MGPEHNLVFNASAAKSPFPKRNLHNLHLSSKLQFHSTEYFTVSLPFASIAAVQPFNETKNLTPTFRGCATQASNSVQVGMGFERAAWNLLHLGHLEQVASKKTLTWFCLKRFPRKQVLRPF